jgi:hypothetical protein
MDLDLAPTPWTERNWNPALPKKALAGDDQETDAAAGACDVS